MTTSALGKNHGNILVWDNNCLILTKNTNFREKLGKYRLFLEISHVFSQCVLWYLVQELVSSWNQKKIFTWLEGDFYRKFLNKFFSTTQGGGYLDSMTRSMMMMINKSVKVRHMVGYIYVLLSMWYEKQWEHWKIMGKSVFFNKKNRTIFPSEDIYKYGRLV